MDLYTLGVWTIQPGHEDEFIDAWRDLATRTAAEFPAPTATLLRDREQPNRIISYGPWKSMQDIESWRNSATFSEGVARIRAVLDAFESKYCSILSPRAGRSATHSRVMRCAAAEMDWAASISRGEMSASASPGWAALPARK